MTFLFIWLACAIVAAIIASSRGRSGFGWFLLGCLLGIFTVILVAVLPSKKAAPVIVGGEVASPETHIRCPWVKGLVRREATICMPCRQALVPEAPAAPARHPDV